MDEWAVEEEMYEKAVAFLNQRYGIHSGGVGIVRVDTGEYYISVWNETLNSCVDLCAETGAILEAHKYNKKSRIHCVSQGMMGVKKSRFWLRVEFAKKDYIFGDLM